MCALTHGTLCPWATLTSGSPSSWIPSPVRPVTCDALGCGLCFPMGPLNPWILSTVDPFTHGSAHPWILLFLGHSHHPSCPWAPLTHGSAMARAMAQAASWNLLLPLRLFSRVMWMFPTDDANLLQVLEVTVIATVPSGQRFPRTTLGVPVSFDCPLAVRQCPPCRPPATFAIVLLVADTFLARGLLCVSVFLWGSLVLGQNRD